MLAAQFANLRNSDRFWYENDLPPSSLNLDQLQAIRRVSLAGLLCQNNAITKSQSKAFIREDPYLNVRLTCDQSTGLDLSTWKVEEPDFVEVEKDEVVTTQQPIEEEEVSSELIENALARAKEELIARKKFEYESWLQRK